MAGGSPHGSLPCRRLSFVTDVLYYSYPLNFALRLALVVGVALVVPAARRGGPIFSLASEIPSPSVRRIRLSWSVL